MLELKLSQLPEPVREIPSPPQQLFYEGADLLELLKLPRLAIVGTRKPTPYGRQVTQEFARKIAEQGIVIVSGLAYGVDAIAHDAALDAGGICIAVLPGPLDNVVPKANESLARRIVRQGGALVSEQLPGSPVFKQLFVARNRLMSGLSDAVLVTEASAGSGTMHTADYGNQQNRVVMAVPGSIYAAGHAGVHNLIKTSKAHPVTTVEDVLTHMQLHIHSTPLKQVRGRNHNEQAILDLMLQGISDGTGLLERSGIDVSKFNQSLTMLEIAGKIRPLGANHWAIS
jgi:DNA processing protein